MRPGSSRAAFSGAFAYPGGLFIVTPSERPASTYTHEMGHIFWARDEYPGAGSWTDRRGYYNAQNVNASDNPTPGFVQQDSIMRGGAVASRAYDNLFTPDSTLELIGWRDSDGDGIFDVADVPLLLDAVGSYDVESGLYSFQGTAQVDTLANQNSAGFQSDISLNRISEIQYRFDGGDWQTALSPDTTRVEFDLEISPGTTFDAIEWRAIDASTGVTSAIVVGDRLTPAFSGTGGGFAFIDQNGNNGRDADETFLVGTQFNVRKGDGSELLYEHLDAQSADDGTYVPASGMTIEGVGYDLDGRVASLPAMSDDQIGKVFQAYNDRYSLWIDRWGEERKLSVSSEQPTGQVTINFAATNTGEYGLESGSYARVEAFDVDGNRIDRVTSELVLAGGQDSLTVKDSLGRIASVLVYGHAETEILITGVQFGLPSIDPFVEDGHFSIDGLPDGDYLVEAVSPSLIYQFQSQPITVQVSDGSVSPIALAASRVDSPRHNVAKPEDVNLDGAISVLDALVVINDLSRLGSRTLTPAEASGYSVDVNNDGMVSAIDALFVINLLERIDSSGEGERIVDNSSRSAQTSESTPSSNPTPSDAPLQPLAATSVDAVFAPNHRDDSNDPYDPFLQNNPSMLNSAGKPSSDQSQNDAYPDSSLGEGVPLTGENGAKPGFERHSLEFSISDDQIQSELRSSS